MGKWLQSNEHLTFEVRERVARITLNRPDRRNARSWEMLSELRAALLEADDLRSVSVIVLGGAGPDFCAGYDMKSAYARYAAEGDAALDYRSGSGSFDDDVSARLPPAAPSARHRRHRSRGGSTHRARSSAPRRAHLLS